MTTQQASNQIRLGIIGMGGFAGYHLNGLSKETDKFKITWGCDSNVELAEKKCKQFNIPNYTADYRAVIESNICDAVIVSLPHFLHKDVCVAAASRKKHVIVDKPIARNLVEADAIISAVEREKITLMVAYNQRFDSGRIKIKDLLKTGDFGKPLSSLVIHHQNFNRSSGWWRSREAVGGGCLIGSGVHLIDLMLWYFGDIAEIFAFQAEDQRRLEAEMVAAVSLRFKNGAVGSFFCNWGSHGTSNEDISLFLTEGDIRLQGNKMLISRDFGKKCENVELLSYSTESLWTHFYNSIINETVPLTNGRESRKSLEVVMAIYHSFKTGQPVRLPLNA